MKPKVALGLSGFMCRPEICRSLGDKDDPKAVCNNVDTIILGDGRYPLFDWHVDDGKVSNDYSSDDWMQYTIEQYPNYNIITYKLAGEQIDKRNKYLDIAAEEKCDYVLVWDSDEFIHYHKNLPRYPDWNLFYDRLTRAAKAFPEELLFHMYAFIPSMEDWDRAGNVSGTNIYQAYVRLIKNPGEVKYVMNHYSLAKRDRPPHEWLTSWILIDGVRFSMDAKQRSPAFLESRRKWAKEQQEQEYLRLYHYMQDHPDVFRQLIKSAPKQ